MSQEPVFLSFDEPWDNNPFIPTYKLRIKEYLGESEEEAPNEDYIVEKTTIHKYQVKLV